MGSALRVHYGWCSANGDQTLKPCFFSLVFKVEMCVGSSSSCQLCFRKRKLAEAADFHLGLVWMQSDSGSCRHKQMWLRQEHRGQSVPKAGANWSEESEAGGEGRGGGFSHTYSWGRWEKALHHHELIKSAANWFRVENEHPADFKQCRFGPVSTQSVTGSYQWPPPC